MLDFLLYIGRFLIFTALSELLRPKNRMRNPALGLKDLDFPTADPTRPVQWLIGKRLIDNANLFATFDFRGVERSKKVKTGLFSRDRIPLPPEYYVSAGMVLCGGSGARLREIWVGDRLAWTGDAATGSQIPISVSWTDDGQEDAPRGIKGVIEFFSGSSTPSAYLEAKRGAGNVPAWKHLTYVVLRGSDGAGAWIGTSRQVEHLKFVVERMPTAESTGLGAPADGGSYWKVNEDANLAYAAAEVMTSPDYGAGIGPEQLDPASFHETARTLFYENHGTSQLWDSQRASGDVVLELCRQGGMILVPDPVAGLHKLKVLRAADEPVLVLDHTNIKSIDAFERTAMDEAVNAVAVQYTDRTQKWKQFPAEAHDRAAIEVAGQVIPSTQSYAGLMSQSIAGVIAIRDLRAISSPLATARVQAIVPKRQRFMPGDAVLFTSPEHGVTSLRMRVTSARYSRPGEALCELELVEDVFRSGEAVYSVPAPVGGGVGSIPAPGVVHAGYSADLIHAPYALIGEDADRGLFYASAPDTTTTAYDLAWYDSDPAQLLYHPRSNIGFAAIGTLAEAMPDIVSPASVVVNITAANAATLRRFGSQPMYCMLTDPLGNQEAIYATGVSVNAAGTQATLTGISRGVWDTVPYAQNAGAYVVMLCDYAVDVAPMKTTVTAEAGKVALSLDGQTELHAVAYGKNMRGTASAGNPASLSFADGWSSDSDPPGYGVRAALPYTPGAVKLGGVYGSSARAAAPNVTSSGGVLTVSWSPRNRLAGGMAEWGATGAMAGEPGTSTTLMLQTWNGSYWVAASTKTVPDGTATTTMAVPAGTKPLPLRLTVYSSKAVAGTVNGIMSKEQSWYFNLTA